MEVCTVRGLMNFIACSVLCVLKLRMYLQGTLMSLKNLLEQIVSHRLTIDSVSNCNYCIVMSPLPRYIRCCLSLVVFL